MVSEYKGYTVKVINEPDYEPASADNLNSYALIYNNADYSYNTKHGIRIIRNDTEVSSALITGNGGGPAIHERSYLIKEDNIFVCCSEMVYSLRLPILTLNWAKQLDMATCFEIYEFESDFITHGETEISRLTEDGLIKWQFSASDIFVNLNGKKEFEIIGNEIKLVDFQDNEYLLDANGMQLS